MRLCRFEIVRMLTISSTGLILAGFAIGCGGSEKTGTVAGPPLTIAPTTLADDAYQKAGPAIVAFVDLTPVGTTVKIGGCQDFVVSVAKGHASALKQDLGEGDSVVDRTVMASDVVVSGTGLAVVTQVTTKCAGGSFPPPAKIAATRAPELSWANGAMHAHLDIEDELHGDAYFGRLSGTASVPEHVHDTSTEIVIAIEANGTLIIDGKAQHLGNRQVVAIPPGTKHSWVPDAGTKLVAFQMYAPPGPEERFKALAAGAAAAPK
jgi:mannose-6-phosphate isomerase-like protein (cupin superfamily)